MPDTEKIYEQAMQEFMDEVLKPIADASDTAVAKWVRRHGPRIAAPFLRRLIERASGIVDKTAKGPGKSQAGKATAAPASEGEEA